MKTLSDGEIGFLLTLAYVGGLLSGLLFAWLDRDRRRPPNR